MAKTLSTEKFAWFKIGISTGDYDVVPEELGNFDVLIKSTN